jgi:hypothetical protein
MLLGGGLDQVELHILALDQVLVLILVRRTNGRVMNENLLTRMLPVIYGDESVSGLVIKPLNLSQEAFGLNLISVTHDVTGMKYRLSCFYIVFGFLMLSAGRG